MSEDLEKFVLAYEVRVGDSPAKLRQLEEKMGKVKKESQGAGDSLKSFAADATDELGKLAPGLDAISKAIRGMGGEFALAAGAIGGLAIAVKSVIDLRAQYNAQRQAGMDLGVSGTRVENYQRAFVRASGGYVDRDKALEGLKHFREMSRAAFTDPSRVGRDAQILRRLGVNVGAPGSPASFNNELTQLATSLQGKSQAQVQGIAQATGFAQDFLLTLQKLGPQIGHMTELSSKEIEQRKATEKQVAAYGDSLNKLKGDYNQLEMELGKNVIPAVDDFTKALSKLAGFFNTMVKTADEHSAADYLPAPAFGGGAKNPTPPGNNWFSHLMHFLGIGVGPSAEEQKKVEAEKKRLEEQKKADEKKSDAKTSLSDKPFVQAQQTADQMTLAIHQFAAAVSTFADTAPSIQEVLAAWAGGAGQAAGLPGSSNAPIAGTKAASGDTRGLRNNNPGNLKYGAFAQSMGATGADSGGFAIFPSMGQGADAARKLIDNYRKRGVDTVDAIVSKYAPSSDGNNHAAYLGFLATKGFQPGQKITNAADAARLANAMMINESGYRSHPNAIGYTRSKLQRLEIARGLAGALGVPEAQLLQGGVSQTDIAFMLGAARGKLENEITSSKTGIATLSGATDPTSMVRLSALQTKLRMDQMKLQNLNAYGDKLVSGGAAAGGYSSPQIASQQNIFNIQSTDPKEVAKEIEKILGAHYDDAISGSASQRKS